MNDAGYQVKVGGSENDDINGLDQVMLVYLKKKH